MAKTFNYNHKPQYIAIKTYQIMPCTLPLPAVLPLPYQFAKISIPVPHPAVYPILQPM